MPLVGGFKAMTYENITMVCVFINMQFCNKDK